MLQTIAVIIARVLIEQPKAQIEELFGLKVFISGVIYK